MGEDFLVIEGQYNFEGYDKGKFLKFIHEGHILEYFEALENSLIVMRGSACIQGLVLRPIKGWPFSPAETTAIISAMVVFRRKYTIDGNVEYVETTNDIAAEVVKKVGEKKRTGIFVDVENVVSSMDKVDQIVVREKVCPSIAICMRMVMSLRNISDRIVCYSDAFNVWGFVVKYYVMNALTYNHYSRYDRKFDVPSCNVSLKELNGYVGMAPLLIYLEKNNKNIDNIFSRLTNPRVLVVTKKTLRTRIAFNCKSCDGYNVYSYHFPIKWSKIRLVSNNIFVFTEFYRDDDVYRLNGKEQRELMMRHVYFASDVKVSGSKEFTVGFNNVRATSGSDVGFVGDTFVPHLKCYVSLVDGRKRFAYWKVLTEKMHVIEGTFVRVYDNDTCKKVYTGNKAYFYARRSGVVIRKRYNSRGNVVGIVRHFVNVYSSNIRNSPVFKCWQEYKYDECEEFRIR
jgi:hypothetical protein